MNAQKRFLIDVAGVLFGAQQMVGEPQHALIMKPDERLKSPRVATLGFADQIVFALIQQACSRTGSCGNPRRQRGNAIQLRADLWFSAHQ